MVDLLDDAGCQDRFFSSFADAKDVTRVLTDQSLAFEPIHKRLAELRASSADFLQRSLQP